MQEQGFPDPAFIFRKRKKEKMNCIRRLPVLNS